MDQDKFQEALDRLIQHESKLASLKWSFYRGVMYGFGIFVGSVILVSLFVYVLNRMHLDGNNFFTNLIQNIINTAQTR